MESSKRVFKVKVIPKSRQEKIEKIQPPDNDSRIGEWYLKLWVKEPAEKGKANSATIELLARYFNVPKKAISIKMGKGSRRKTVEITT